MCKFVAVNRVGKPCALVAHARFEMGAVDLEFLRSAAYLISPEIQRKEQSHRSALPIYRKRQGCRIMLWRSLHFFPWECLTETDLSRYGKFRPMIKPPCKEAMFLYKILEGGCAMSERMDRQINFILELDKEKNILRQTHLTGHGRRENDAEHSWHLAVMAYLLKEYANEPIDIARVMIMCLIHDAVEIDAGDTYAYDKEGLSTQKEREAKAADRIFGLLPADQRDEFRGIFEEFEANETPEARFAHAMDNFQPLLLNNSNNGGDWKEHDVCLEQVLGRQNKTKLGSEEIFARTMEILEDNVKKGTLKK